MDASGGNRIINLPTITSTLAAFITVIKIDNSSHTVTVVPNGSQTVNGQSSYVISRRWQYAISVPDTTNNNWVELAETKLFNIKPITSSGSYTPTVGTKYLLIAVCGGGGGGSGANGYTYQGAGGGAGGGADTAIAIIPVDGLTFPASITIGPGALVVMLVALMQILAAQMVVIRNLAQRA